MHAPLQSTPRAVGVEEAAVRSPRATRGRAVVAREDHDRLLLQPQLRNDVQQRANSAIHVRHHRGIPGARRRVHLVTVALLERRLRDPPLVLRKRSLRYLHRHVRHRQRQVQEERLVRMVSHERLRPLDEEILRVMLSRKRTRVARQLHATVFVPQVARVMIVGVALAVVAVEAVETLPQRTPLAVEHPEPPLPDRRRRVAALLQELGDRHFLRRQRRLPLRLHLLVVADECMPPVLPRQQHRAARCADGGAGVVRREAHPLPRQPVQPRRADDLLPVAPQVPPSQVVRHDEDDTRRALTGLLRHRTRGCCERQHHHDRQ